MLQVKECNIIGQEICNNRIVFRDKRNHMNAFVKYARDLATKELAQEAIIDHLLALPFHKTFLKNFAKSM